MTNTKEWELEKEAKVNAEVLLIKSSGIINNNNAAWGKSKVE